MPWLARIVALGAMLALAGCVTTENSLSQNDLASFKLTGVAVSFAPDVWITWEDGIRAYANAKTISDDQISAAANTPEGKAYVQGLLAQRIKAGVEQAMAGQLAGARPVRLDIVVKRFDLPSAVQRVLIGGHRGMTADANLVDARTGAVILAYPNLNAFLFTGQGIAGSIVQAAIDNSDKQSPADKVIARYGETYRVWLLHNGV
ncbi:DUF6778 family protein [Bradyrhizobium genosp. L]|uniref:DUF6778 family protein n=1 Tax=Bradyrhizobium genosp. L TaxID=83637 RepID=UPI001FF013F2|nr:DUF6778 family protein [Bradyrhizobium genosp. L]